MCCHQCIDCFLSQIKCHLSVREYNNIEKVLGRWKRSSWTTCRQSQEEETLALSEREIFYIMFYFSTLGDCKNHSLEFS